jgi:16S rRNA (cytosine1402-N4)-methyltransferase
MMRPQYPHQPVLVHEVIRYLVTTHEGVYVDGTVGTGGHSEAILREVGVTGRLIGIDRDSEAIEVSRERLVPLGKNVTLLKANYADLDEVLRDIGLEKVHGILLDLGMSTFQLENSGRGFSFNRDEPLDMRMDPDGGVTAQELVNQLSAPELEHILRVYGEEGRAKRIAKTIERERSKRPIGSSLQLANLIQSVVPRSHHPRAKHPATRTFQALRIAVNRELEHLKAFLDKAPGLIFRRGRLVVLSYHSLEDRMVKRAMTDWERGCRCPPDLPVCGCGKAPLFKRLHKRGIRPDQREIESNPKARSAMMRAAERV